MDNNSEVEVVYLYLDDIIPNRFQPREIFDDQALKELAVSIKEHGVIQPIIVRKVENKYEIIAGERRYKASTMAGLTKIPAIVKNFDDKESSKVALIENLQRKDLTPIEEARTYQKILELENEMTQEQLAATIGKTQSSVSNKLRLLSLPDEVQDALLKEKLSERHARSLLNIEDKNEQIKMMERVVAEKMTVRELDRVIKEMKEGSNPSEAGDNMNTTQGFGSFVNNIKNISNVSVDNNSLSASDILNEDTQTTTSSEAQLNVQEETNINPTEVDINKIRESAVDIIGNAATEPPTEEPTESFKFVPTFGINYTNNSNEDNTTEEQTKPVANQFSNLFNSNSSENNNSPETENNNVPSSINAVGITLGTPEKDLNTAVDKIKSTIEDLKNNGYNISMEESDDTNNYKITINIEKDA